MKRLNIHLLFLSGMVSALLLTGCENNTLMQGTPLPCTKSNTTNIIRIVVLYYSGYPFDFGTVHRGL